MCVTPFPNQPAAKERLRRSAEMRAPAAAQLGRGGAGPRATAGPPHRRLREGPLFKSAAKTQGRAASRQKYALFHAGFRRLRIGVRYLRRPHISNTHPKYPQIEKTRIAQGVNVALLCTKNSKYYVCPADAACAGAARTRYKRCFLFGYFGAFYPNAYFQFI